MRDDFHTALGAPIQKLPQRLRLKKSIVAVHVQNFDVLGFNRRLKFCEIGGVAGPDALHASIGPPLFPIGLKALPGNVAVHGVADDEWNIGEITVMSRLIPHVGHTLGFRAGHIRLRSGAGLCSRRQSGRSESPFG